jgi:hypothetical protein
VFLQTTLEPVHVWERLVYEVTFLSRIAKSNGSFVSLKDLASLTRTNLSEEQLKCWWEVIPELRGSYELENGLIIERHNDRPGKFSNSLDQEKEKRARAESYARYAGEFASLCTGPETKLIAISGSTSYHASSEADDLDIFCITKPDHLWLFLTKSLLLARFMQIFRRNEPRICFSYAVDQNFVMNKFLPVRDPLFARDALTTIVIHGQEFYEQLLRKSSWISNYFPRLYQHRTSIIHREPVTIERATSTPVRKFVNLVLLFLTGNYIRVKSSMLNRRLRRQGKTHSFFKVKIGRDHCVFESTRYVHLQNMYREFAAKNLEAGMKGAEQH